MVSMLDGRRTEAAFQPILGEAGAMRSEVAEVTPRKDKYMAEMGFAQTAEDFRRYAQAYKDKKEQLAREDEAAWKDAKISKAKVSESGGGSGKISATTLHKEQLEADKNAIINNYSLELGKLADANAQGKFKTPAQYDLAVRQLTGEYLKQNLVDAGQIYQAQKNVIGVNIGGKLLEADLALRKNELEYEQNREQKLNEAYEAANPYLAGRTSKEITAERLRNERMYNGIQTAIENENTARQAGVEDMSVIEASTNEALTRGGYAEVANVISNTLAERGNVTLNDAGLAELQQDLTLKIASTGIDVNRARSLAKTALDRWGFTGLTRDNMNTLNQTIEVDKKTIEAAELAMKKGYMVKYPSLYAAGQLPREMQQSLFTQPGMIDKVEQLVSGEIDNPSFNITDKDGMLVVSSVLKQTPIGSTDNERETNARNVVKAAQAVTEHTSRLTPQEFVNASTEQKKAVTENYTSAIEAVSDPVRAAIIKQSFTPEEKAAMNSTIIKGRTNEALNILASIKESALGPYLRYNTASGRFMFVDNTPKELLSASDDTFAWAKSFLGRAYENVAAPYAMSLVDTLNDTASDTNKIVGATPEQHKVWLAELARQSGVPAYDMKAEKELARPIAQMTADTASYVVDTIKNPANSPLSKDVEEVATKAIEAIDKGEAKDLNDYFAQKIATTVAETTAKNIEGIDKSKLESSVYKEVVQILKPLDTLKDFVEPYLPEVTSESEESFERLSEAQTPVEVLKAINANVAKDETPEQKRARITGRSSTMPLIKDVTADVVATERAKIDEANAKRTRELIKKLQLKKKK